MHNLPESAARVLALAEVQHNPDEMYDSFTFDGADIGIGADEIVIVKYYRRKATNRRVEALFNTVQIPVLEGA